MILELKAKGDTTILLSTHDMGSVEEMCDEVALLNRGQLVLNGKVPELREAARDGRYAVTFRDTVMAFYGGLGRQRRAHRSQSQPRSSGRAPRHAAPARGVRHRHVGAVDIGTGGAHVLHALAPGNAGHFHSCSGTPKATRGMNKLALIIYREWITRVRRRAFIIGTLMVPVLLGLGVGLGAWLENAEMEENKVLVVDLSGMITFWDDTRQAYLPICPECFPEREQLEYRFADAALSDDEFLLSDFTSMVLLDDAILQHGQAKNLYEKSPSITARTPSSGTLLRRLNGSR